MIYMQAYTYETSILRESGVMGAICLRSYDGHSMIISKFLDNLASGSKRWLPEKLAPKNYVKTRKYFKAGQQNSGFKVFWRSLCNFS